MPSNRIPILVLRLCLFLGLATSRQGEAQALTLSEAKDMAIAHNPEVAAAKESISASMARRGLQRSTFYPRLGLAVGSNSEVIDTTRQSEGVAYLYAHFNLFNGFKDRDQATIARIESEKAEQEYERIKYLLQVDVEQSFNAYLFARDAITLRTKALETNRELAETAQRRRRAGAASEADVIEFELRESILRSELAAFEQEREDARLSLIKAIGRSVDSIAEPTGVLEHQHVNGDIADYLKKLEERGTSVQASKKDMEVAQKQAEKWKSGWLPTLDLEARSGKLELRDAPESGKRTTELLLLAKLDLFSGFESVYERSEGLAIKAQAELKHRTLLNDAATDLRRHFSRILTIQKSVDLEEKNMARAERYYQTVLREYGAGVKNSMDLKAAADLVSETALKRLRYRHDFLRERGEMERLLGFPVDVDIIQESL